VISLFGLSFFILVRKQGRNEIGNEEIKEGRKDERVNMDVVVNK